MSLAEADRDLANQQKEHKKKSNGVINFDQQKNS